MYAMATALADSAMIESASLAVAGAMIDYCSFCLPLFLPADDHGPSVWSVDGVRLNRIGFRIEWW